MCHYSDNAYLNSPNDFNLGPTLEMLKSRLGDAHKFSILFLLFFSPSIIVTFNAWCLHFIKYILAYILIRMDCY